jgi:hypothetical protein
LPEVSMVWVIAASPFLGFDFRHHSIWLLVAPAHLLCD